MSFNLNVERSNGRLTAWQQVGAAAPAGSGTSLDVLRRREVSDPPEQGAVYPIVRPRGVLPQVGFLTAHGLDAWRFYFVFLV